MDRQTETACNRREFIAATALSAATCLSTQGGTLTAALLTDGQTPVLVGNRFLTFNTVVRVNQIEVSRDRVDGSDEGNIHTPELAQLFRQSVQRGWPGGKITWAFSWQALQDPRPNYKAIRDLVAECHSRYGDEVTFIPGGYFQPMYNARQQTRQDLHEALQRVSDIVGGGYRPRSVLAGFLDAASLKFLAEKEDIHVCQGNIWSQYSKLITQGEFGEVWRRHYHDNSWDYRFEERGSGIGGSDTNLEVRWFMNRDFRLALLRDWKANKRETVIDFTRYDLTAKEPSDPSPAHNSRNWSLINRLNMKRTRPQDTPVPLARSAKEELDTITRRYPTLVSK